jgi:hypothetical protein
MMTAAAQLRETPLPRRTADRRNRGRPIKPASLFIRGEEVMSADGKVVIVTGASQGIGAGLVRAFRARGYRVIANSRTIKPSNDRDALAVSGDIADAATAQRAVATAVERFGRVDTLINNAGIFVSKPFLEYTEADFSRVLAVNLAGFFHITQQAVRQMLQQGFGHIVNITTTPADQPLASVPAAMAALSKGGFKRRHPLTCDRVRRSRCTGERSLARHHQDANAPRGNPRVTRDPAPDRPHGRGGRDRRRSALSGWNRFRHR